MCQRKRGGDVAADWRVKRKIMQGSWRAGILPTVLAWCSSYFVHTAQDLVEMKAEGHEGNGGEDR